jgi:mannan endo-1,4-beta-mannosidase
MNRAPRSATRRLRRTFAIAAVTALCLAALAIVVHPALIGGSVGTAQLPVVAVAHAGSPASGAMATPSGTRVTRVLPADGSRYFGVSITQSTARQNLSASFRQAVGVDPTLQMFFESFTETFDLTTARRITAAGGLPMLTWEPYDHDHPSAQTFPLKAISGGKYDVYLRAEAKRFSTVAGPLVIRFAHEMNGDWYPWGVAAPGNTAADYVAAFRHVHDVVTAAGAHNVVWVWAPNLIDADPSIALAPLYPGNDVVDWVGLSGYFTTRRDTFASRFTPTLTQVDVVAPDRPILVAETSVERTVNRAAQIADLVDGVRNTPRAIGLVWFDAAKRADWSVDDDPSAAAALGAAIRRGGFGAHPE